MNDIGSQYDKDDIFKKAARKHQSEFRTYVLKTGYKEYGNRLDENSAQKGLNFYAGIPEIFKRAKQQFSYEYSPLYFDMLRSEHIPYNFISPLDTRLENNLAENVFSFLLGRRIREIKRIKIEWSPCPKEEFLNDNTAFDSYIEYIDENDKIHAIGIEFKYTEKEYEYGKKEKEFLFNHESVYWTKEKKIMLYKNDSYDILKSKTFKQFFRNHLLGFTLLLSQKFKYLTSFTSVLIFPNGNNHFKDCSKKYKQLLNPKHYLSFIPITFEEFIFTCEKWCEKEKTTKWLNYLKDRYIVSG